MNRERVIVRLGTENGWRGFRLMSGKCCEKVWYMYSMGSVTLWKDGAGLDFEKNLAMSMDLVGQGYDVLIQREHTINRVCSYFSNSGHSDTLTKFKMICTFIK